MKIPKNCKNPEKLTQFSENSNQEQELCGENIEVINDTPIQVTIGRILSFVGKMCISVRVQNNLPYARNFW